MKIEKISFIILLALGSYVAINVGSKLWEGIECHFVFCRNETERYAKLFETWNRKVFSVGMASKRGEYAFYSIRNSKGKINFHFFEYNTFNPFTTCRLMSKNQLPVDHLSIDGGGYDAFGMKIFHKNCFAIAGLLNIEVEGNVEEYISTDSLQVWSGFFQKVALSGADEYKVVFEKKTIEFGEKSMILHYPFDEKNHLVVVTGEKTTTFEPNVLTQLKIQQITQKK